MLAGGVHDTKYGLVRAKNMQSSEFKSVYRAEPFRPFVVNLADGRNIRVEHPEFMAVSPTGRSAVIYGKDGSF